MVIICSKIERQLELHQLINFSDRHKKQIKMEYEQDCNKIKIEQAINNEIMDYFENH